MVPPVWVSANSIGRALLSGVGWGVLGAVLLWIGVAVCTPATISGAIAEGGWTNRSRAWLDATRFHPAEHHEDGSFSWTAGTARLAVPHLNRSRTHTLGLRLRAGRPAEFGDPPQVAVYVDGVAAADFQTSNESEWVSVLLPATGGEGTNIRMDVSDVFKPGPHDARHLGVIVESVSLSSDDNGFRPSRQAAAWAGLAIALCACGVLLCSPGRWTEQVVCASATAGFVLLLLADAAFLGPLVERLVHIALPIAVLGGVVAVARSRGLGLGGLPEWPAAVAIGLIVFAVKAGVFAHPLALVGDGIFQVHRFQVVSRGEYFFTSVTPRPFFEFPYPVALYVAALPFSEFFPSELDLLRLLRGVSLAADTLVGLALYAAARRQWGNSGAAILCAVLWWFSRAPMFALSNSNLTNAFGQSLFTLGLLGVVWFAARPQRSLLMVGASTAVFAGSFLSHFSTLSIGLPLLLGVVGVLVAGGGPLRRAGWLVLGLTLAAATASYLTYYSHFTDTYRDTLARIRTPESGDQNLSGSSMTVPPTVKFSRWIREQTNDYGLPSLPLAIAGAIGATQLIRHRRHEAFTLVLAAWAATWMGWTALGILTPIEMRVLLAAAPLFACLAAYGLSTVASSSRFGTVFSVAAVLAICWEGARVSLLCLGIE